MWDATCFYNLFTHLDDIRANFIMDVLERQTNFWNYISITFLRIINAEVGIRIKSGIKSG